MKVVLTSAAAADLEEAFAYISSERAEAAGELLGRIRQAFEQLREFPLLGAPFGSAEDDPVEPGVRFVIVGAYLVFYRVLEDIVVILRILHARRDSLGMLFE